MMQPIKFCFSSSVITIGLLHKTNCENFFEKISKKKEIKIKKKNHAAFNILPITDTSYEKFVVIDIGRVDIVAAYKPSSA
jgi:hypothetical protein